MTYPALFYRSYWVTLALVSLLAPARAAMGAEPATPLATWHGEYFDKKQGGLFLQLALSGFKATAQTKYLVGTVQVTLVDLLRKETLVFAHEIGEGSGPPREVWKLASGKYEIFQVVMVDLAGVKRQWTAGVERKFLIVRRQCLSNLGLWTLAPEGKTGLSLKLSMVPSTYKESGDKRGSSVAAVLNGYTGLIEERLGGKNVVLGAEKSYGTQQELRASITFTRQIAMFYKLDLFRHNSYSKPVAAVLAVYDPNLRRCFTERLEVNDKLRGDVKFAFLLSRQTGTMTKLKYTGGSAADPKLVECMYNELGRLQFPVAENMVGELTYTYDVK